VRKAQRTSLYISIMEKRRRKSLLCVLAMAANTSASARPMTPVSSPVPLMVCVLPELVTPYANIVPFTPAPPPRQPRAPSAQRALNTAARVSSARAPHRP